jgi:2'-5' RNA ligase
MPDLVIVAIPSEDDYIYKISSEEIPHLTLLFLGESKQVKNFSAIADFVKHASKLSLTRFGLEVERRGELGEEQADVLFFAKRWNDYEMIRDFRSYLLKNNDIRTAYDSIEQFPEWVPHITLGYADAPAKEDKRDYPGINYVSFDKVALWFADFEGIEFPLKAYEGDETVEMSNLMEKVLTHHGVKGMKWGVRRKATVGPQEVIVSDRRKKLKTSGGAGHPAHSDAVSARTLGQRGKKSGLKSLSNKELTDYAKRLQLEQNVKRLNYNDMNPGKKFVAGLLGQTGKNTVQNAANDVAGQQVKKRLAKIAILAA